MTLAQYASFICSKIGQTDTASLTQCKEYVKRRYEMIYNAYLWRDSLANYSTTVGVTGIFNFPAGLERIIAIRAAGTHFISPVDTPTVFQIDPESFERTGTPVAFEEYVDTADSNTRKVRVVPTPSETTAILIRGKRTLTNLSADSDEPIIRNIDNCLIAFAQSDMLERARQYAKAAAKVQEGLALQQQLISLERDQAASQPRVIPMIDGQIQGEEWLVAKG